MTVTLYEHDESGYLCWIAENPEGFVVNMRQSPDPDYLVLHYAHCASIKKYPRMQANPGGFTERGYRKLCSSSVSELKEYLRLLTRRSDRFSKVCSRCNRYEPQFNFG